MILPEANEHDLDEVPPELARKMTFHFVSHMDQVLELALAEPILPARSARGRRTSLPNMAPSS